jgi:L-alanine-DL-glutamate epimerase-like enolase superfamily enzyme
MSTATLTTPAITVERLDVAAYTVPTETPESDSTLEWDATTLVLVQARAVEQWGLGYTYADTATATLIRDQLADVVVGHNALAVPATWAAMLQAVRNLGRPGICSMAIAAVDCALWDLKARLLGLPLVTLLGQVHEGIAVYGSGGFTSYNDQQLTAQLTGWVEQGIPRVKMKVGRDATADPHRVAVARRAVGEATALFIDANGGYSRKQALAMARRFAEDYGVTWFEEPRPAEDLAGLRLLRDRGPAGLDIAAGEYGYHLPYFKRLLDAGAVDCLQADVTRCSGMTGFLGMAALCEAAEMPLSAHCAPAEHTHVCCALRPLRHLEYFYDHARIERLFFDGVPAPVHGMLQPDRARPGMGLVLKERDAEPYRVRV